MPPPCPQCRQSDQVQGVPALYATQVSTVPSTTWTTVIDANGTASMIPVPDTRTAVTPLGRQLAPPSSPLSAGARLGRGCLILVAIFAVVGIAVLLLSLGGHTKPAPIIAGIIVAVAVPVAGAWFWVVRQRRPSPRRAAYQASHDLWRSAFICTRCSGTFFKNGVLSAQLAQNGLIPVAQFTAAIADLGRRLASLDPVKYPSR